MRAWSYRSRVNRGAVARTLTGRRLVILATCLVLAGCAGRPSPPTPEQSLALLRTGQPVLSCREPCLAEWQIAQPQAAQLDAGRRSRELAVLVMRIGYQDDLSLYYLGRAAEGMGYRAAAVSYYRQSMQLSGTSISCQYLSRQCGGVALPRAAESRVAALERMLNPPRPRRPGPGAPGPASPETPEAASGGAVEPAPTPLANPAPSPGPGAEPPRPAAFEYIEPPPAAR